MIKGMHLGTKTVFAGTPDRLLDLGQMAYILLQLGIIPVIALIGCFCFFVFVFVRIKGINVCKAYVNACLV